MDSSPKPAAKTGAENSQGTSHPRQPSGQSPMHETQNDPEFWPLSGKPYFYAVLDHISLRKMKIPHKLSKKLPAASFPAKILYRGNVWNLPYNVSQRASNSKFENWKHFVEDNNLEVGDACVFELVESSSDNDAIQFKVQILKGDFPSELLEKVEGFNTNNPISID